MNDTQLSKPDLEAALTVARAIKDLIEHSLIPGSYGPQLGIALHWCDTVSKGAEEKLVALAVEESKPPKKKKQDKPA